MLQTFLNKSTAVLYVEHKKDGERSIGRYYALLSKGQRKEITREIANMNGLELVPVMNQKVGRVFHCAVTRHPESCVRTSYEMVFGEWNSFEFYSLDGNGAF